MSADPDRSFAPRRLLVVAPSPDERVSTASLLALSTSLERRGWVVTWWYLRPGRGPVWGGSSRCIDDLRTWLPAAIAARLAGSAVAGALRGRRLRRWEREVAPEVVVLDDGLGARAVPHLGAPFVVVRNGGIASTDASLEVPWTGTPDLVLDASIDIVAGGGLWMPPLTSVRLDQTEPGPGAGDEPIVLVGRGTGGWGDGADLFIRLLWHLEHRHQVVARGRWHLTDSDRTDRDRLAAEADRCGVADRFELTEAPLPPPGTVAPVTCIPSRLPVASEELLELLARGSAVLTFSPAAFSAPGIIEVPPYDLDAAAAAVVAILARDRTAIAEEIADAVEVERFADRFVQRIER